MVPGRGRAMRADRRVAEDPEPPRGRGAGSADAFLAKFSSNGELVWDKTWGGDGFDMVNAIAATNDGGCVLTGYTFNFGDGSGDAFIAKFTSNGELVWDKTWGVMDGIMQPLLLALLIMVL